MNQVKSLVLIPETFVWILLMCATLASWLIGSNGDSLGVWSAAAILGFSFFKVRLVIQHFMEIKHAPWPLRLICEAWVLVTLSAMLVLYYLVG